MPSPRPAPSRSREPRRATAASTRNTTSGSSTDSSPCRSPPRAAPRKASITLRCPFSTGSGAAGRPCTRRRARLASWRVASGDRPTMEAISSKLRSNMSCSTKVTRSAGVSVSSTTSRARPTASASCASSSGLPAPGPSATASGRWCASSSSSESSRRDSRARSMSRQTRPITVVSQPRGWQSRPARHARGAASFPAPRPSASLREPSMR